MVIVAVVAWRREVELIMVFCSLVMVLFAILLWVSIILKYTLIFFFNCFGFDTFCYPNSFQDARKLKPEVSSGFGVSHWKPHGFGIGCL